MQCIIKSAVTLGHNTQDKVIPARPATLPLQLSIFLFYIFQESLKHWENSQLVGCWWGVFTGWRGGSKSVDQGRGICHTQHSTGGDQSIFLYKISQMCQNLIFSNFFASSFFVAKVRAQRNTASYLWHLPCWCRFQILQIVPDFIGFQLPIAN